MKASCPKWESVALQHLEDVSIDTISMHFIDGGKEKGQGSFALFFKIFNNFKTNLFFSNKSLKFEVRGQSGQP